MKKINFAYDGIVGKQVNWFWHYNSYDTKYYPINGVFDECYYDYHAPLQTVFEKTGIETNTLTVREALQGDEPFVYLLTFRYLLNTITKDLNYNFFIHLPIGIVNAVNSGKCILVLNDAHESALYSEIFYTKLVENLKNASIDITEVIVVTGNQYNNVDKSPIKLLFWQYFETAMRLTSENVNIRLEDTLNKPGSVKKFLCLNRIPRETRYYFMYEMYRRGLVGDFRVSLNKVDSVDKIISYNNNVFLDSIEDKAAFQEMLKTLPWVVDTENFSPNHWDKIDNSFSYDNIVFITTETLFQGDTANVFLTEKTFKPISLKMPFIIIGQPTTLNRLKDAGYKTFDNFWDESYDLELDPQTRMKKICDLVESLSKLSTEEMIKLRRSMSSILEYNFNLLMSRRPEQELINEIKGRI